MHFSIECASFENHTSMHRVKKVYAAFGTAVGHASPKGNRVALYIVGSFARLILASCLFLIFATRHAATQAVLSEQMLNVWVPPGNGVACIYEQVVAVEACAPSHMTGKVTSLSAEVVAQDWRVRFINYEPNRDKVNCFFVLIGIVRDHWGTAPSYQCPRPGRATIRIEFLK